jgi:antitoxin YefM
MPQVLSARRRSVDEGDTKVYTLVEAREEGPMYRHVTLKQLRPKLPTVIDEVDEELDRYIISKHGKPVAVLLSIDDFEGLVETAEELADRENLKRIRKGMQEARAGRTVDWAQVKSKYHL